MRSRNHFLSVLDQADFDAIAPMLQLVELKRDDLINEAHQAITHVYLPLDCILSVITVMKDGAQVESRTIGWEGGHGLLHAIGASYSHERMVCQIGGEAMRIPLEDLTAAAAARPGLVGAIAQHAQMTHVQLAQSAACNVLHSAHARLARWLMMTRERLRSDVLPLTQEHLAIMLGVQRSTVNPIAQHLQDRGLITYSRGRITILDSKGLHGQSCECLDAVRQTLSRTVGSETP